MELIEEKLANLTKEGGYASCLNQLSAVSFEDGISCMELPIDSTLVNDSCVLEKGIVSLIVDVCASSLVHAQGHGSNHIMMSLEVIYEQHIDDAEEGKTLLIESCHEESESSIRLVRVKVTLAEDEVVATGAFRYMCCC